MRPCFRVEFVTPAGCRLQGLWFGPQRPRRTIVFVHGMMSSAFSMPRLVDALVDAETSVLTFNNRGCETIVDIERVAKSRSSKASSLTAGTAHEVFSDTIDDLDGAIRFVRRTGVKQILLAGHSTGCQKCIFWARRRRRGVNGVILLAPISDYAAAMKLQGRTMIRRATRVSRALVKQGRCHQLIPSGYWHEILDAQRFLSLYTPNGVEELIFPYAQPGKAPRILQSVRIPILAILAANDEYNDRPVLELASWFRSAIRAPQMVRIVAGASHEFTGVEKRTAQFFKQFVENS